MSKRKYNYKGLMVQDKGFHNFSVYITEGYGLTFEEREVDEVTYMTHWTLATPSGIIEGKGVSELLEVLKSICESKGLQHYSPSTKDVLVIYTDKFIELGYYLRNYIPEDADFATYFQVFDYIEFRGCWDTDKDTAFDIANWSQNMINDVFIPNNYFYATPSQVSRKQIEKNCKQNKVTLGPDIFPKSFEMYDYIRSAVYGGICYCPYPGVRFTRPMLHLDLKSAYIFCFILRHICTKGEWVEDTSIWERYLDDDHKFSIGEYRITYSCWSKRVTCYKTIDKEVPSQDGVHTDTFLFSNKDLKIFLNLVDAQKVECLGLIEYDTDYLPKEVLDVVIQFYINKEHSDKKTDAYALAKIMLNAIYGNTIRKYLDAEAFDNANEYLPPQWGVFITAYCKELLLGLALQLEGWVYSDTDSIFCFDTPENREKLKAYNEKTRKIVKAFCDKFGYNFEDLKKLGSFEIEDEVVDFRAWKQKQYAYKTSDGKVIAKASGCEKAEFNESILSRDEGVPVGEKVVDILPVLEPHTAVIDGEEYHIDTSYFKKRLSGEEALYYLYIKHQVYGDEIDTTY